MNRGDEYVEYIKSVETGEWLTAVTAGSIIKFADQMLIQYVKKQAKKGHSWLDEPIVDSEKKITAHLRQHCTEILEEEPISEGKLLGLALMAMMIVTQRELIARGAV